MRAHGAGAIVPPFASPGDPIHVVAPSGVVDRGRLAAGIAWLESHGHPVRLGRSVAARHGYLAGRDAARARDVNEAISEDSTRAILFARGGYGITRILDQIDLEGLRRRPKILLGFSDMTALFMSLQGSRGYLVMYGPVVSELGDPAAFDAASFWAALYGRREAFEVRFRARDVLRGGRGTGRVIGGCLSLLVSIIGTPWDPDYRDAILFWEDVGEEPYRIDRMLTQLRNAGKLDHLRGMVVGSLTRCDPAPGKPSLGLRQILQDLAKRASFPIVWNVQAGHIAGRITLPLGAPAVLDTSRRRLAYAAARHDPRQARSG